MKTILSVAILVVLAGGSPGRAQSPADPKPADPSARADLYYYFTLGHLKEQEYGLTGGAGLDTDSIDAYKKALDLDPGSPIIMERLAEVYAASQRIRDAVAEAQEVLKIAPDDLETHRLLARIYVRTLGDINAGNVQTANVGKAVEQLQAVLKIAPDDIYSALLLARLHRFENRADESEKILRGILQKDPGEEQAIEQLSQLLVDQGRSQEAIALLSTAAGDSSSPDMYDLLGDAYSQAKNYAKAEEAFRRAVGEDPDEPSHRHGLGQALAAQYKYVEAIEQYKKLTVLEPSTADNYLRLAQIYRQLGQYDSAESILLRAKQLAPGNVEILYNEALLYEDQGRYDDAAKVLTDAIHGMRNQGGNAADSSALALLFEQLGHVYRQQEKFPAAIENFGEMAKLGPESQKRAQMLLIDTYLQSRDIDRAITEAQKALDASPNDPSLTVTLAMLYAEKPETATATKLLQGLLRGNDDDQQVYLQIAQALERGKKYAEAEQSAQKAERMAREPSEKESASFMLGAIYDRQEKFDQAEEQFRKTLDANPNNAAALNYYGYMLADRGIRLDEAMSLIGRAVKQEPNNGAYLDSLGWAYYKQNMLAEAEEYLRRAVNRLGHDPTILSHLGDVYLKLGQTERAAGLLERSLAEWQKALPDDYEAHKVAAIEGQLKNLKRRLAQKSTPQTVKPQ